MTRRALLNQRENAMAKDKAFRHKVLWRYDLLLTRHERCFGIRRRWISARISRVFDNITVLCEVEAIPERQEVRDWADKRIKCIKGKCRIV